MPPVPAPASLPTSSDAARVAAAPRRPWTQPTVTALPPLTTLTLQSGGDLGGSDIDGVGGTGFGGSTVF